MNNNYIANYSEAQLPDNQIFKACQECGDLLPKDCDQLCFTCSELEKIRRWRLARS